MEWAEQFADVTGPIRGALPPHHAREGSLWDLYRYVTLLVGTWGHPQQDVILARSLDNGSSSVGGGSSACVEMVFVHPASDQYASVFLVRV